MPAVDWNLVDTAWLRLVLVATAFAALLSGFSIRQGIRAAGWPRWSVRLATIVTWGVALATAGRLLLLPLDDELDRTIYWALFAASAPIIAFWAFGLDATRRAIDRRPTRRVRMLAEITAIHDGLPAVQSPDDRTRLDEALADLDRFVEPATFEYIQLTRSRIVSWLDGGPRAPAREERWAARMAELAESVRPESWWQGDPWSRLGQRVRGIVMAGGPLLAAASGVALGRSVLSGPVALATPAAIVAGYLLTWRWFDSAAPVLATAAGGLVATALLQQPARPPTTMVTAGSVAAALVAWALFEWRRRSRRPGVRLVPPADEPASDPPRAS
jgi:hypothetical protein